MKISRLNNNCRWPVVSGQQRDIKSYVLSVMFFALFTFYLSLVTVSADEYHYNNMLIGERAAGMGGAYTAISDDPSGLYYNPAGIVYFTGSSLSASANAFHISSTKYKGVLGGADWERTSSSLLPNFFGIVQPLGKGKIGFSYAVTDSMLEDQDESFTNVPGFDRYVINFNRHDNTYKFGPSYAVDLGKKLSVGMTLYYHQRDVKWILNQETKSGANETWNNSYYESYERGVNPVLGIMWTPTDKLSVGLTARKTMIFESATRAQSTSWKTGQTSILNPSGRKDIESDSKREYPLSTTLGIAYFPSNAVLVSGDFSYYEKTKDDFAEREAIWNAALGTEYYFNQSWAIRAGLFSNKANTPDIKSGDIDKEDHVDLYGGSLSMTHFTRQSSITLGGSYSTGSGKAQVVADLDGKARQIQDVELSAATVFLAASYSY